MTTDAEIFGEEIADYTRKSFKTSIANNEIMMA
jgi:hypothetical protein